MHERLANIETRYNELMDLMARPEIATDHVRLTQLAREQRELEEIVTAYRAVRNSDRQITEAQQLLDSDDAEMRALAADELEQLRAQREALDLTLKTFLLPRDPNDARNAIIELRQGEGGDEAALFAADLFRMYTRYAERHNWKVEVVSAHENGIGGFKEVIFEINGENAYSRLKYEGGVHRVQRVPATEARGRIHTSTATCAVLPEVAESDVELRPEDYRVDVFRAGGHGGQGVNTTDSAVRIVYKGGTPEEIVVTCQDGRSQLKNKAAALAVLRARLYSIQEERRRKELGETRLAQVGSGERAEKIRTYNFPQDRVTDHRLGQNFSNLPGLLDGDIDRMIDALIMLDNTERLEAVGIG
ncbi:MAG TPA: peptide chain release factor 1 [Roseiflexaceae bacterium]|nr:peptide chain release factor 1 [Roseiflexaceae bacterium]